MCCRCTVAPVPLELVEIMMPLGMFNKTGSFSWNRRVDSENCIVNVAWASPSNELTFFLSPSVGSPEGHHHKRESAGIMFEMATRIAQKAGTTNVRQTGINVHECMTEDQNQVRHIWDQTKEAIDFEKVCPGWRREFLDGSTEA